MKQAQDINVATTVAETLRDTVEGPVDVAGDEGYDTARLPWQRAFDPYPAVVVEATGVPDVQAAVRAARDHDLPFAVQATGHGIVLPSDGGVLLKTTAMDAVEVDPARQTARVGGGVLWGDVIAAAAPHGLAPLSGTSTGVGVAGYTLGGGAGWLSRTYGFAADSLLRAHVVTADGTALTVSGDEHPDLFWALRGGGGNFGVVTALEFRLYPVTQVYGGMAMFDADRAAEALTVYREWALTEPDASNTALMVMSLPPSPMLPEAVRGRRVLALRAFYLGDEEDAERALAPLREVAGPPLMGGMRTVPFAEATTAILGPPPPPMAGAGSTQLFRELPDEMITAALGADRSVAAVEVRHWGGAMARPQEGAGPVGHRDVPFSVTLGAMAQDREQLPAARAAVEGVAATLRPYATGGSFLNFLADPAMTSTAYTPEDHRRLAEVKKDYDPDNFFNRNHNIPPAG